MEPREKKRTTYIQKVVSYKNVKGFSRIDNISLKYKWERKLGEGSFGMVFQALHIKAQTRVAIKQINKSTLAAHKIYQQLMKQELMVLEELDHPHVVRVIELLESDKEYFVVMELMPDGNLLDFINGLSKRKIPFLESDAANLTN